MRGLAVISVALISASAVFAAGDENLSRVIGKNLFERVWVPAPSSTRANDGLGPLFNARACTHCHQGLNRAISEVQDGAFTQAGMIVKLSDAEGRLDPAYGGQLQTASVPGLFPEGRVVMTDGGVEIRDLAFGSLAKTTHSGVRAAPAVRGLGLIEAVPEEAILSRADPDDRDGDGISGRANWIIGPDGKKQLGRFGLKASAPTIAAQTELAFSMDLGMSTPAYPSVEGDCRDKICKGMPHGGGPNEPEIRGDLVAMMADYLASVPPLPPAVKEERGAKLFASVGCASCHTPSLPSPKGDVHAYSDLLLHDLGPQLDGGATEPGVAPTEWRTAPLWGMSRALETRAGLLHDGRASGVEQSVSLHGGEASQVRTRFGELPADDRARLIRYVEGL